MSYKKESLEKLLLLLDEICSEKENSWFKEALISQLLGVSSNESGTSNIGFGEFFKLLKKQFRIKANKFYENIKDKDLKNQLVNDCVQMYWYQINNDVNQLFVYTFFQMENMLNYYASHSNCYEKIKLNKDYYTHTFSENFIISCSGTFLNKDDSAKSITKVNIWSKLIYWAYDTNNIEFLKKQGNNFSNLINVRNNFIHKSAEKNKPENFAIDYVRQSDYTYFGYYINLLKEIVKTLENISGKVEKKGFIETNIILPGPNILGKIDPASLKRR